MFDYMPIARAMMGWWNGSEHSGCFGCLFGLFASCLYLLLLPIDLVIGFIRWWNADGNPPAAKGDEPEWKPKPDFYVHDGKSEGRTSTASGKPSPATSSTGKVEVPPLRLDRDSVRDGGIVSKENMAVARLAVRLANELLAATRKGWNEGPGKAKGDRIPNYRHPAPDPDDTTIYVEPAGVMSKNYTMEIPAERETSDGYLDDLLLSATFGNTGTLTSMTSTYEGDIRDGYLDGMTVKICWPYGDGGFGNADVQVTFPDKDPELSDMDE